MSSHGRYDPRIGSGSRRQPQSAIAPAGYSARPASGRGFEQASTPYLPEATAYMSPRVSAGVHTSFAYPYASGTASAPSFTPHPPHGYQGTRSLVPETTGYAPGSGPGHDRRSREASAMSLGNYSDPGTVSLSGHHRTDEPDRYQEYSSREWDAAGWTLAEGYPREQSMWNSSHSLAGRSADLEPRRGSGGGQSTSQRRQASRDEFDGPHQLLDIPPAKVLVSQDRELPQLPTNLLAQKQDEILAHVNDRLSLCAYNFVARYQFPIPVEADKRSVSTPSDREWTEWVYLLKRLATKRRIPARVLYNGQIKQLVTVLENSMEMRHAAKHQSRPLKDDRNVLQLISAGIQVAKILKDADAMESLDQLYLETENLIHGGKASHMSYPQESIMPVGSGP